MASDNSSAAGPIEYQPRETEGWLGHDCLHFTGTRLLLRVSSQIRDDESVYVLPHDLS